MRAARLGGTGIDVTSDSSLWMTECFPRSGVDRLGGKEEKDGSVERIENAMRHDLGWDRNDIDRVVADDRFGRAAVHTGNWWKFLLEGLATLTLQGVSSAGDLTWEIASSPVALIGRRVTLIGDDEAHERERKGLPGGSIEWAHITCPNGQGEVIVFALFGPGDKEDIRIYATTLAATSLVHRSAVIHHLMLRTGERPALEPMRITYDGVPLKHVRPSLATPPAPYGMVGVVGSPRKPFMAAP